MNLLKAALDLLNGKKLNTGTIMVIVVVVLKQFLGVSESEAQTIATNVMMGVGGVMALWGYIHRLVKGAKNK
jgi:hypothetical protein